MGLSQGIADGFRGLTRRGRTLFGAGVGLGCFGIAAGLPDLEAVGVLLVALPGLAAVSVGRTRYRVACTRRLARPRVAAGEPSEVTLVLENVSRWPTAVLLAEESIPPALGAPPRFSLARVEAGGKRTATYVLQSAVRGRFRVGPLVLRLTDPFGLCDVRRSFAAYEELIVTPRVVRLPPVALGGAWAAGGESTTRTLASVGEDDIATRSYRHGDDLRRVHWRSTARAGELMVRREEQPWQSRATLLLDTRAAAHRGKGEASSFEWAVSAAASIGVHLSKRGDRLRALTDTGADLVRGDPDLAEGMLLDALAVVTPSRSLALRAGLAGLGRRGDGLLVAVCGALTDEDVAGLVKARGGGVAAIVLVDAASWSDTRGRPGAPGAAFDADVARGIRRAADLLTVAGWRVMLARRGDSIDTLWPAVARWSPGLAPPPVADSPAGVG